MKRTLLQLFFISAPLTLCAQWTFNSSNDAINNNSSGKVGIGIGSNSASSMLDVSTGTTSTISSGVAVFHNGDPNLGMKLMTGSGDGSSYSVWNGGFGSWYGLGFYSTNDNVTRGVFNVRTGDFSMKGSLTAEGTGYNFFAGNVGIGTSNPGGKKLYVQANTPGDHSAVIENVSASGYGLIVSAAFDPLRVGPAATGDGRYFIVSSSGNVGVGITNPAAKLSVNLQNASGWGGNLKALRLSSPDNYYYMDVNTYVVESGNVGYQFSPNGSIGMTITTAGKVGIGTLHPDVELAVKGVIHSSEVRVDMGVQGPDYVFEKDYNLLSLTELETYINQNKHLPEVPSAKEMEKDGLNLKEMNLILLKKVEELTLHLIEQQKRMEHMDSENVQLQKRLTIIENKK
jgi:hypothetical protein